MQIDRSQRTRPDVMGNTTSDLQEAVDEVEAQQGEEAVVRRRARCGAGALACMCARAALRLRLGAVVSAPAPCGASGVAWP